MRHDICLFHLRNTLFAADPRDDLSPWLDFRAINNESTLSFQCLQSLAKAYFGRVQAAPSVLMEGSRSYVQSLQLLNDKLRDPARRNDNDNLLAIMILETYEVDKRIICYLQIVLFKC